MAALNRGFRHILQPFIWFEHWLERFDSYLNQWALVGVLDKLSKLSILIVVITYFIQMPGKLENERKREVREAWQVINTAAGKGGSGGIKSALGDLVKYQVPLMGINLSSAFLPKIDLQNQNLSQAQLEHTVLRESKLQGCNFNYAILIGVDFWDANLEKATFMAANLSKSSLVGANLQDAVLISANLSKANLLKANMKGASLSVADLSDAYLGQVDLRDADLDGTDLSGAVLEGAQIVGTDFGEPFRRKGIPETKLRPEQVLMAASWDDSTRFPPSVERWLINKGIRSAPPETEVKWKLWEELGVADEFRELMQ
jgi:uncharacterized protein YjbI with pentapeptide repeats